MSDVMKFRLSGRLFEFDLGRSMSYGEVWALEREIGLDPDRLARDLQGNDRKAQRDALIVLAYLAAVREDHELRWRDFIWSVSPDSLEVVDDEPAPAAEAEPTA